MVNNKNQCNHIAQINVNNLSLIEVKNNRFNSKRQLIYIGDL